MLGCSIQYLFVLEIPEKAQKLQRKRNLKLEMEVYSNCWKRKLKVISN